MAAPYVAGDENTCWAESYRRLADDAVVLLELVARGDTVGNAPGSKWCARNAILEVVPTPQVRWRWGRLRRDSALSGI